MIRATRRLLAGIRALIRRQQAEKDLDEELASYLEAAIDRHMRGGMSREAATRAARIEIGSGAAVKQQVREAGWESRIDALWLNLRYASRTLRRAPGFALIAIGTLAMGIGATTVMFSAIDGVLLRPLPYPQPDRLVWVWGQLRRAARSVPRSTHSNTATTESRAHGSCAWPRSPTLRRRPR